LNVWFFLVELFHISDSTTQHKLGADRMESFLAVPVNPQNRLKDEGLAREIGGWTAFDFKGRGGKVRPFDGPKPFASLLSPSIAVSVGHTNILLARRLVILDNDANSSARTTGLDWDHKARKGGIYRIANKKWSQHVDSELGNYDYLLGVDVCPSILCLGNCLTVH
jgi:alpha-amylase